MFPIVFSIDCVLIHVLYILCGSSLIEKNPSLCNFLYARDVSKKLCVSYDLKLGTMPACSQQVHDSRSICCIVNLY